ncbi:MAG: type II toxin-antitoxin system HigB family toxin [Pirellulales bacterium]|nr:type II toxin-antitoxin system HigB family toxin [Pirellulales bacterium]
MRAWYLTAVHAEWSRWAELVASFPQADQVGDCVVFNLGNSHRLIGRVRYAARRLYVLRILTHAEYDKSDWPTECGCHERPPRKLAKRSRGT